MAETRRPSFCGSPEHALNRRGFLGSLAAGAAAFAADMTALDVLKLAGAGRRAEAESQARHPALAGRRLQPARDLGPQAGHAHRRPVPLDPDVGARHPASPS